MDLFIPYRHLVALVGPSDTGKTTLARRMCQEAPIAKTAIIAADREMTEAFMRSDYATDIFEQWIATCIVKIDKAYQSGAFVVFDLPCTTWNELTLIFETIHMVGLTIPIVIIKMHPAHELQLEFARHCHSIASRDHAFLKQQHAEFTEIAQGSVCDKLPWIRREYLVTDPRDLQLKFVQ